MTHKIYFNTSNKNKVDLINEFFRNSKIEFGILNYEVTELLTLDLDKVIRHKAAEAYRVSKVPIIVEHGGLEIDYLGGYPGGLSKPMWDTLNEKICKFIPPGESRNAVAVSAVCYCDGKRKKVFWGRTKGEISQSALGKNGFQWDPIFIPEGTSKTFSELTLYEKLEFSQAIKAYKEFEDFLNGRI